jgi:hypothetical protein
MTLTVRIVSRTRSQTVAWRDTYTVTIATDATVGNLKQIIRTRHGFYAEEAMVLVALAPDGQRMVDEADALRSFELVGGSAVHLTVGVAARLLEAAREAEHVAATPEPPPKHWFFTGLCISVYILILVGVVIIIWISVEANDNGGQ